MKIFFDANICLDLLDSKRPTSKESIEWYMHNKDNDGMEFYFSSDFISTFYYILTQKRKYDTVEVIHTIEALSLEIDPFYLSHVDFLLAKESFLNGVSGDFEDFMILESAVRLGSDVFVTNDKALLSLKKFKGVDIITPKIV
jgi:predicted nucleic acid-binding protein